MTEVEQPSQNGVELTTEEDENSKARPADIEQDMREMERRKRVEAIMSSKLFREELERIVDSQIREGGASSGILQQLSDIVGVPTPRVGNVFKSSNCVLPINDIRDVESMGYSKGEKILRCKLAATFRLLDLYGWAKGLGAQITARLKVDQELFLVNPHGLLFHEVTASSLNKVDMQGNLIEPGTTNFGVNKNHFILHSIVHAARPDIRCAIYIGCNPVVAVSSLKVGLLPLTNDSVVLGEISTHQYSGCLSDIEEREKLVRNLGPVSKVMLLTNHGALCCGETIEEAFFAAHHIVQACETQLKLLPMGIDNLVMIPEESRKTIYDAARRPPEDCAANFAKKTSAATEDASTDKDESQTDTSHKLLQKPKWRAGGAEFEALMRMLDNAGFRTGYIYRHPLIKSELPKPKNDVEVPPAVSSLGYLLEEEELYRQGIWKKGDWRKGGDRSRWLNSPHVYQKVEVLETGTPDPKKITKWVAEGSPTHSTPVRIEGALQFVPPGTNPKEFKKVQQQIKDNRRADKISAGPQSHILEGVTWDEANRIKDATVSSAGDHVVLMGAASKGIIQRGFQHNATVYKAPYAKNPFDNVTDDELNEYKRTVERKKNIHGEYTDTDFSESEALSSLQTSGAQQQNSSKTAVVSQSETEDASEHQVMRIETKQAPVPTQPEVVLSDDITNCEIAPKLEIFPTNEVQRKPVGKPLILTCRPRVPDPSLVTDLQWKDSLNNTILPKPNKYYYPLYDSKGRRLPTVVGRNQPPMYTETLPGESLALMISTLTPQMEGKYYCTASYANTEILETSVVIKTYVSITWTNAPENQYPILGSDYTVKCEVTADPNPTVDWMRNGDQIRTNDKYVVETHGLLIRNVQESDDGVYTCRAAVIETGELVERVIRVEVYIKPVITFLPTSLEAVEGKTFATNCTATGKPVPEISWIKDSTQQNVATADRFKVNALTGLMTINSVSQDDYDTYTCIAKNAAGVIDSKTKLNVLVRPTVFEFYNITGVAMREVAITCRSKGRPAPAITFRRWGSEEEYVPGPQPDDDRIVLEQHFDDERGESSGTLRISRSVRTDDGLYQCIARNKGDTAFKTGHITMEFPPDFSHMKDLPPTFSWEQKVANLSCLAQSIPNATIEWRWNGRQLKNGLDQHLVIRGTGPRSDLIVTPVSRQYYSVYKCIATNIHGSMEHDMQLKEASVPGNVQAAMPRVLTATTITFEITGPATELGLPITAYSVQYKEEINPDWSTAQNRSWSPDSPYIVEGLKPQTAYMFRFAARNIRGLGQWSAMRTQSTPKRSAPEEPKPLHSPVQNDKEEPVVVSPYSDHFELRWSVPADNGEPIDFYQVKYCPGLKVSGTWEELAKECRSTDVIESTSFEMPGLSGNTYYRIELRAHNAIGFSSPASIIMKTTRGVDVVQLADRQVLSSASIVGIAIGGVLILLVIIDLLCCLTVRMGVMAAMCRRTKRSPSEIDEETKLGSGQLVKEPPPSPLPLPPPVKLGGSPMTSPLDEKQPLHSPPGSIKKDSSVEFDGKFVHSRSGEIIGKNSAV